MRTGFNRARIEQVQSDLDSIQADYETAERALSDVFNKAKDAIYCLERGSYESAMNHLRDITRRCK